MLHPALALRALVERLRESIWWSGMLVIRHSVISDAGSLRVAEHLLIRDAGSLRSSFLGFGFTAETL